VVVDDFLWLPCSARQPSSFFSGTSSGFGMEIALQMAGEGARRGGNDVDVSVIVETLEAQEEAGGKGLARRLRLGALYN
jgi:hypothetical protein